MDSQSQREVPHPSPRRGASFLKTCFNGLNTILGLGMLSMPYALSQGGWLTLILLIFAAMICLYTGLLLQRCMDKYPEVKSYPDIGDIAFGCKGRALIATFMYSELYLVAVEFLIMGGDNLHYLFPNENFKIAALRVEGKTGFDLITALAILPTTWLRSLGVLAYISACGILASITLTCCVLWVGVVDDVGFHERGQLMKLGGLPSAMSIFAFCYCGHAVFPTLSNSMRDRSQFHKLLLFCFVTSTITFGFIATIGYLMFGDYSKSEVTLNLPMEKISTDIAIYTTLFITFSKYAVIVTPISIAIEDTLLSHNRRLASILIRTIVVVSTLLVALFVPFFGYIMSFIGAFSGLALSWLLPCLCYLKINVAARGFGLELMVIIAIIQIGSFIGILGTYTSVREIITHLQKS